MHQKRGGAQYTQSNHFLSYLEEWVNRGGWSREFEDLYYEQEEEPAMVDRTLTNMSPEYSGRFRILVGKVREENNVYKIPTCGD